MAILLDRVFNAQTEALAAVRNAVRTACQQAGCGEECSEQVVLAINEACMNVIQHGYGFAEGASFALQIRFDNGLLTVYLLDNAMPVGDADLRPRALEELRPGGLGVRFMRESMDSVAYVRFASVYREFKDVSTFMDELKKFLR